MDFKITNIYIKEEIHSLNTKIFIIRNKKINDKKLNERLFSNYKTIFDSLNLVNLKADLNLDKRENLHTLNRQSIEEITFEIDYENINLESLKNISLNNINILSLEIYSEEFLQEIINLFSNNDELVTFLQFNINEIFVIYNDNIENIKRFIRKFWKIENLSQSKIFIYM